VARPYYAEALRILNEGAADCATIDAVMREAGGFRMGPFELMDMIGHDVNFAVTRSVWNAFFNDQRFLPSLIQQELVDAGFYGRKSAGFYDYRRRRASAGEGAAQRPRPSCSTVIRRPRPWPTGCTSGRGLHLGRGHDGRIAEVGDAVIFVTDGRSATRRPPNRHRQHGADRPGPRLHQATRWP
jgi:3-hydroxybutyryl-CoA dehydrogenase